MKTVSLFLVFLHLSISAATADELSLKISDGSDWAMPAGKWTENEAGETHFSSPDGPIDEALAFYKPLAWRDVEIECDFKILPGHGDAGIVLRAQDVQHYYVIHFPLNGQAYRTRNFWVAISKVDNASGWTRCLKLGAIPGVTSEVDTWHHVRAKMAGDEIQVWVDGRGFEPVRDSTFKTAGRFGLMGFYQPRFKNIVVRGTSEPTQQWDENIKLGKNWFTIFPTGSWQRMCSITRAPNGKLVMLIPSPGKPPVLIDSDDNGRTWRMLAELPGPFLQSGNNAHGGVLHATKDKLVLFSAVHNKKQILRAESNNSGKTWSELAEAKITGLPADCSHFYPYNPMIQTRDGTWLWPAYVEGYGKMNDAEIAAAESEMKQYLHYALNRFGFVLRSKDNGQTWSVSSMHGPASGESVHQRNWLMNPPDDGGCEASIAQLTNGEIVAYSRPEVATTMWETRSTDDGNTWSSWARSAVPGWASAMVCTKSDALLLGHRMPGNCVHLSRDGGLNWDQGTRIETSLWSQGVMIEVEPDLVLYVYMDNWESSLRGQFMRVTQNGLEPVAR